MLVRSWIRLASKAAVRRELQKIGPSRSSQVNEIHKRLADFQRTLPSTDNTDDYAVDSLLSEKLIQKDTNYKTVLKKREESRKLHEDGEQYKKEPEFFYPLVSSNVEVKALEVDENKAPREKNVLCDRGFYVDAGQYVDEYIAGTTENLIDDEILAPTRMYFGPEDAVEHIDFQLPGQKIHEVEQEAEGENLIEWSEQFGTADPERSASKHSCSGCGAKVHCKDSSLPGFLPVEVFEKIEKKKVVTDSLLCKRCHLLKHHNFLLNVNVCPVDYAAMMSHLKLKEEALILLVVDIVDLTGSIHRHLPEIIGSRKPMIVIGNKVDLLPPDARVGYLKHFRDIVQAAIENSGFREKFNILHTALVSAKTGYGIEDLITEIHLKWTNARLGFRNDMYIVGCTNAGKSTLFNAFLGSDLCKVRAVDLVERATTSVWPGTTISLLKFPVMKQTPYRLEIRRRRLLNQKAWIRKEENRSKLLLQETGDSKYAVLTGTIQNSYKDEDDNLQPVSNKEIESGQFEPAKIKVNLNDPLFSQGTWCYDTPGTVSDNQVVSLFTLDELVKVLPRRLLVPRTALVHAGYSLLIGGVGRVDVKEVSKDRGVYLTTFVNDDLPLNIIKTDEVNEFYKKYLGTEALLVPSGGEERLKDWPGLSSDDFIIRGYKKHEISTADIVLSSIGWVSITAPDKRIKLRAWSVGGKGLAMRDPILPYAVTLRGRRIPGSYFYKVKPIAFPEVSRREKRVKKKKQVK